LESLDPIALLDTSHLIKVHEAWARVILPASYHSCAVLRSESTANEACIVDAVWASLLYSLRLPMLDSVELLLANFIKQVKTSTAIHLHNCDVLFRLFQKLQLLLPEAKSFAYVMTRKMVHDIIYFTYCKANHHIVKCIQ